MKNIYVGNLSFDATEDQVRSMFEAYGPVDRVSIVTDRDTGQPRGFAFVEMSDDDSAGKAMEALNGTNLGGRNLTVNEARPKTDRPRGGGGGGGRRRSWRRRWRPWRWWWRPWSLGRRRWWRRLGPLLVLLEKLNKLCRSADSAAPAFLFVQRCPLEQPTLIG